MQVRHVCARRSVRPGGTTQSPHGTGPARTRRPARRPVGTTEGQRTAGRVSTGMTDHALPARAAIGAGPARKTSPATTFGRKRHAFCPTALG
ncbi:hypothetical protein XACLC80_300037 [Xanthomonas citri pv. citri]|nr:hypothetical protein XACLC80_300037 [Xanthomonas citri pv. citri]